jgi:hypothetical protein
MENNNYNKESSKGDLYPKVSPPDKLSDAEAEILKKYLGSNTIDSALEEEIDKLKEDIEKVGKTISPDAKNPIGNEIEGYLKAKKTDAENARSSEKTADT